MRSLVALIADGSTATPDEFVGLNAVQIREVAGGQRLSDTYECFLALIGGDAGRFLGGSDAFADRLLELPGWARELLAENDIDFDWQPTDRVIRMHQGYEFDLLRGAGDDPEVWHYNEVSTPAPVRTHARFTDWLAEQVDHQTKAWATTNVAAPDSEPQPRRATKRLPGNP